LSRREYSQRARHRPDIHLNLNIRGMRRSATVAINEQSDRLIAEGRQVFKVQTLRCPTCGYLEQYATEVWVPGE